MRESLVAWAADCVVRGEVSIEDGRLSDRVNELDLLTFHGATLRALDDGREFRLDEVEVERRDLHLIEVEGRRGDPSRRLRTVEERVALEVGPFRVTGNLHRPPNTGRLAALSRRSRFVPVTDAEIAVAGRDDAPRHQDVVLVNRDRIVTTVEIVAPQVYESESWEQLPAE